MKKVLITGKNSYIGNFLEEYLKAEFDEDKYHVDKVSLRDNTWKKMPWGNYDTVLHAAGIAHVDIKNASEETKEMYYKVNRDLTLEAANKAKEEGTGQFIFLSSMIVFGSSGKIDADTKPAPTNFYGDSKLQAENELLKLDSPEFKVAVVRPPFVYGKESRGNYPQLARLSRKLPVFPSLKNKKSMIYAGNLCEFLRLLIEQEKQGIFHPQNREIISTAELVSAVAAETGHMVRLIPMFNPLIKGLAAVSGLFKKVFGNFYYVPELSEYEGMDYRIYDLKESIRITEEK